MGWVEVALMSSGKAKNICDTMRIWFCTYGTPKEISSNGGPLFEAQEYNTFLKNWGIWKCTSSAYYPQSNGCAELAVKTAKQILFNNTDNSGCLCQDQVAWALLTHHNTPIQDLNMSPAVILYGQIIKDHLPVLRDKYQTQKQWKEIGKWRKLAVAKRNMQNEQFYTSVAAHFRNFKLETQSRSKTRMINTPADGKNREGHR